MNPAPDLDEMSWVRAAKNYASWRYSTLDQITTQNVAPLRLAWTFSTGVLRDQEMPNLGVTQRDAVDIAEYLYTLR